MSEFEEAIDYFVDESRVWIDRNDHATIVCHCTASANPNQTDTQLGDYFRTNAERTSVHYGIDRTGAIAQYVREKDGAGGNGILDVDHDPFWDQYSDNPNWHSLSVECENDINNSLPLTDPQKATLFKLIKYWVKKYNIPVENIKGHFTLEPVNRVNCPGPQFPWNELFAYLANAGDTTVIINLNTPGVSTFFTGSDTIWQCIYPGASKGFLVGNAILKFYKEIGGGTLSGITTLGLPKGNEVGVSGHPGVVEQEFERAWVRYDPKKEIDNPPGSGSVYLTHVKRVGTDQTLVATLRALAPQLTGAAIAIGKL